MGYKFLPDGFFFGPQIDFYTGYKSLTFNYQRISTLGIGETSVSGPVFGARGSLPIAQVSRIGLDVEGIPFGMYGEDGDLNDNAASSSSFQFDVFGSYDLNEALALEGRFEIVTAKTKFQSGNELSHKQMDFVAGLIYNF